MSPIVNVFGRTRAAVTASRRGVQRRCASSCRAHGPPVIEATRHSLGYGGVCATQACRWVHHGAVSRQVGGRHARGDTGALTVSCWRAALVGRCLRSQAPATMTTLPSAEVVFKEDSQCKQCHASFNFVRRRVRLVLARPTPLRLRARASPAGSGLGACARCFTLTILSGAVVFTHLAMCTASLPRVRQLVLRRPRAQA